MSPGLGKTSFKAGDSQVKAVSFNVNIRRADGGDGAGADDVRDGGETWPISNCSHRLDV